MRSIGCCLSMELKLSYLSLLEPISSIFLSIRLYQTLSKPNSDCRRIFFMWYGVEIGACRFVQLISEFFFIDK